MQCSKKKIAVVMQTNLLAIEHGKLYFSHALKKELSEACLDKNMKNKRNFKTCNLMLCKNNLLSA